SGVDFLVGVGGGRVIDTAKIVSYNIDRQFISVPTAASHDGIASSRASVPTEEGSGSLEAHPPIAIVADTGIIASAPHRLLASGCADIISNYTAILDWELAHRLRGEALSEYAIALSRMTAELLMKNARVIKPHHEESAWFVTKALVSSGVAMSIAGSSRPASGGEHKFGHALERIAPGKALHGEACGIGTIMTMYLHGGDWRAIRDALEHIGAPTTPRDLGIDDEIAVNALLMAKTIRPERFTILDMGLTQESARQLVERLYQE
ncbi:MAG: NAD(P)-dependent glycerol-1-phosphate dehydrogenase, partial [Methanoregulaceae archaeon]|nr:NAD(P)-dependent glycerol-1-phosphate dehydrogenase [Methanoregulaceae archaeon]